MTDIVKRLQTENTMYGYYDSPAIQLEAAEEIEKLRAEVERLRADLLIQQGCCDGAAAQDAHTQRERKEHRRIANEVKEAKP